MGYRVYTGRQPRVYDSVLDVGNRTLAQLATLPRTTYYAVTAYDTDGLESEFSDEVFFIAPNSPPTAQADQYTTTKNVALNIGANLGLLANDSDVDGDALSVLLVTAPTHGTLALNADGSFSYTPNLDFIGADAFTYAARDGQATSAVATVTITINPPANSAPIAQADQYVTTRNAALNVLPAAGVLANDSDPDGNAIVAQLVTSPANGSLTLNADGGFSYTPAQNYVGSDSFTYRASDGAASSATATVSLTINPPANAPPVAAPDQYVTTKNTTLTIPSIAGVLANDSDADGNPLSASLTSSVTHGTLSLNANGSFSYTPATDYSGTDSFTYRVSDGFTFSASATVTITINAAPNATPVAQADQYVTTRNTTLNIPAVAGVLANDSDADGDALIALLATSVAHGTLSLSANGSFSYSPALDYTGSDSFSYRVTDNKATSAVVNVMLTINTAPNATPVPQTDQYVTTKNTTLNIPAVAGVLANDSDADGDTLIALLTTTVTRGTLWLNPNGSFSYTPALNYTGSDSFSYQITDSKATSAVATVTLTINSAPNATPVAQADQYVITKNTTLNIPSVAGLLANDSDADGDTLIALLAATVTHGTLSLNANGSFNYTPATDYTGTDSFSYRVSDNKATSAVAMVTLTINSAPNAVPVAQADQFVATENTPLNISAAAGVLANDSDADGDTLIALLASPAAHGTLSLNPNGSFSYTPAFNYTGSDSFSYRATDSKSTSAVAVVTFTINAAPNATPVPQPDQYVTTRNTTLNIPSIAGVLANDSDADGDVIFAVLASSATHGTVSLNADGSFSYAPELNYVGADSFSYQVSDGAASSGLATVLLTVNTAPNATPVPQPDQYVTTRDTVLNIPPVAGVLANDSDADGDTLVALLTAGVAHGTLALNANGSFSYIPAPSYTGSDSFSYRVTDNKATSAVATVTLTINAAPNATPVGQTDQYVTTRNTTLVIPGVAGVLANDSDADGDTLIALLTSSVTHGTLSLNANGSFNYTPASDYTGSDSFSYRASDSKATSAVVTVTLSINATPNAVPVGQADQYLTTKNTTLNIPSVSGVLANDSDADGDTLIALLTTSVTRGTLLLNANGSFSYTPALNYTGSDSFSYRVSDNKATSAVATVTLSINSAPNAVPVPQPDQYVTTRNTTLNIPSLAGVLANDSDADGDTLVALLTTPAAHGTISLNANGSFSYTPAPNYTGADSFAYRVTDNKATSTVASVTLTINATPNATPVAQADQYITTRNAALNVPTAAGVLANDSDADGDTLVALLESSTAHGILSLNLNGSFSYTPAVNYTGSDSFSYRVTDSKGTSAVSTVTLTINVAANPPPVPQNDQYVTARNTTLSIPAAAGVLVNDSDADGDPLVALLASSVAHGTLAFNTNGSFVYTPAVNYTGSDSFSYRATDNNTTSGVAVVTLTITAAANTAPISQGDEYVATQNKTLSIPAVGGVLANDVDGEGDPLAATLIVPVAHGTLSLNANGSFNYTPATNFLGTDSFSYRAGDGRLMSDVAQVTITVSLPMTNLPIATADQYITTMDAALEVSQNTGVLANDSDAENAILGASLEASAAYGTLVFNANGSFTYTPREGFVGLDSFAYRVLNRRGNSAVTTVAIFVNGAAPPANGCFTCFASFDSVLWRRSNAFRAVIPTRLAVPTNASCPQSGVLVFGALAKALTIARDGELNEALDSSAECIATLLRSELFLRTQRASTLLPSKYTTLASNQIALAARNIDRAMALSNNVARARSFMTVAKSLTRIDRTLASGELAPTAVTSRAATFDIFQGRTHSQMRLIFGGASFVAEDMTGTPLATGTYQYSRTAWNQASLSFTFDNPLLGFTGGDSTTMQLIFTRGRGRLSGQGIRGYFSMQ